MLLSLFDLITATVGNLAFVLTLAFTLHGNPSCTITLSHKVLTFFTAALSFATLFALNIERYLSIVHPFFHRTKMTKPRLLGLAAVFWLNICAGTLSYPILGGFVGQRMTSSTLFLIIVVTMYMYISIWRAVRRSASNLSRANGNEAKKMQNLKITKSCAIVVASTVMCFLPFGIVQTLKLSVFIIFFMDLWAITLTQLSTSLNSLVFFWRNPILRIEAKAVLKNLKNSKRFTRRLPTREGNSGIFHN
jgi:hypothetical protein